MSDTLSCPECHMPIDFCSGHPKTGEQKTPLTRLPEFLVHGGEEYPNNPDGYYPCFEEGTDIRSMLESYLDSVAKKMPAGGDLPGFLYYPEDDRQVIYSGVIEGTDVRKEWEKWLSECPSI